MRKAILLICVVQLLVAGSLWAQATTGSIEGRVADPSNAIIIGARIVAMNQDTGVAYSSSTDEHGNFSILNVPPGTYAVKATKSGFEVTTVRNVVMYIDQKQVLDFNLTVGKVSESITITGASTALQTQSMETSEVFDTQDILDF